MGISYIVKKGPENLAIVAGPIIDYIILVSHPPIEW